MAAGCNPDRAKETGGVDGVSVKVERDGICDDQRRVDGYRSYVVREYDGSASVELLLQPLPPRYVRTQHRACDGIGIDLPLVKVCAVGEQLPVLDGDGAVVAAGEDAVAKVRPAEDDVAAGTDAVSVGRGGVDSAAVDGEGLVGVDAVADAIGDYNTCTACLSVDG